MQINLNASFVFATNVFRGQWPSFASWFQIVIILNTSDRQFGAPADLQFFANFEKDEATSGDLDTSLFTITQNSRSNWTLSRNLTGTGFELNYVLIKGGSESGSHGDQP
jgi:hypothetical protein